MAAGAAVTALAVSERKRPLRRRTKVTAPRTAANLALGASCAAVIQAVEEPLCRAIARSNEAQNAGFAGSFPRRLRLLAGLAAMDYGFYLWHVATHKVPLLWRFHRVHHVDPDLDMSTAVRFHTLDMLVSLPWRLAQVRLSGVGPKALTLWRHFFNASILFHHANLCLSGRWDDRLSWLLTTPEMHGVHHSAARAERDSNWSSGFSIWDRLHGTLRNDVTQGDLTIGLDDPCANEDIAFVPALAAPFRPDDQLDQS
ncbi:MAG: sterol desaturase family protein [Novosphingobium sp.]|nr:sterol desaturase family protein [Novosphingobium sp.]